MALVQIANTGTIFTLNQKWLAAKSAWDAHFHFSTNCDFCHHKFSSSACRVFHTVPPFKGMNDVVGGVSLLKDHVIVCYNCRYFIDEKWMSCRCHPPRPPMYL